MRAEEMRKITEQCENELANNFWEEFKDKLFEGIKKQAECRCYGLILDNKSELSKIKNGGSWFSYKPLRDKVQNELESLGYEFSYIDSQQQGEQVSILW